MVSAFNEHGPGNFSETKTCFTDEDSKWKLAQFSCGSVLSRSFVCWLVLLFLTSFFFVLFACMIMITKYVFSITFSGTGLCWKLKGASTVMTS